jgi:hypothetical protein
MFILRIDWYDNGNVSYEEFAIIEDVNERVEVIRKAYPCFRYSVYEMI